MTKTAEKPVKLKPKERPHYVNNKDFSHAVFDYAELANAAKEAGERPPQVTNYIAECFLKISEGLSYKSNFIRYTYREEMIMDAVENCLKAINNYDISKVTRTGNPNAFAYFTQIAYYAFLRRIQKEKKQQDIKMMYIERGEFDNFLAASEDEGVDGDDFAFIDEIRTRVDAFRMQDQSVRTFEAETNKSADEVAPKTPKKKEGLEKYMDEDDV